MAKKAWREDDFLGDGEDNRDSGGVFYQMYSYLCSLVTGEEGADCEINISTVGLRDGELASVEAGGTRAEKGKKPLLKS